MTVSSVRKEVPNGVRAWEKAQIDHTRFDLEAPYEENGHYTDCLWLSTMSGSNQRKCLAFSINPDPPSHRSCMLVVRDCVHRYGRLPKTIISDQGKEFESEFYEALLGYYGVELQLRPVGDPQFGMTQKYLFGTANTHFIHNLCGATELIENVRLVTNSYDPKRLAVWMSSSLTPFLEEYLFSVSDNVVRSPHGSSPNEASEESLIVSDSRSVISVPYDSTFLLLSSPATQKGTAKVVPGRGVIINYFAYRCAALDEPRVQNTRVQVRFDLNNAGSAWVYIAGRWHECYSEFHAEFKGRTLKQIELATRKIRENRRKFTNARLEVNGPILAQFFRRVKDHEDILVQEAKDKAAAESRAARPPKKSSPNENSNNRDTSNPSASKSRVNIQKKVIKSVQAAPAKRTAV